MTQNIQQSVSATVVALPPLEISDGIWRIGLTLLGDGAEHVPLRHKKDVSDLAQLRLAADGSLPRLVSRPQWAHGLMVMVDNLLLALDDVAKAAVAPTVVIVRAVRAVALRSVDYPAPFFLEPAGSCVISP